MPASENEPSKVPVSIDGLVHEDCCYYGMWASRCDDKAFFRDLALTNRVADVL